MGAAKHATKMGNQRVGFAFELSPCHPHRPITGSEQDPVAFPVSLECLPCPVNRCPIKLDKELVLLPKAIGPKLTAGDT